MPNTIKSPHPLIGGHFGFIDPHFGAARERLELDLGCGKGAFTTGLATEHPEATVLAADIKSDRLKLLNKRAARAGANNLETLHCLAWQLIGFQLPDNCLDRVHVLCPDPWPKDKHRRNRLLSNQFIASLARKMKTGAILHLATDDIPYFEWMKTVTASSPFLEEFPEGITDVRHIKTDFEMGFEKEGKPVNHLSFRVLPY